MYRRNDVDNYLSKKCEELVDDSFDILGWWKVNAPRYKVLSQIARDVLAVPVRRLHLNHLFLLVVVFLILLGVHWLLGWWKHLFA